MNIRPVISSWCQALNFNLEKKEDKLLNNHQLYKKLGFYMVRLKGGKWIIDQYTFFVDKKYVISICITNPLIFPLNLVYRLAFGRVYS